MASQCSGWLEEVNNCLELPQMPVVAPISCSQSYDEDAKEDGCCCVGSIFNDFIT